MSVMASRTSSLPEGVKPPTAVKIRVCEVRGGLRFPAFHKRGAEQRRNDAVGVFNNLLIIGRQRSEGRILAGVAGAARQRVGMALGAGSEGCSSACVRLGRCE